MAFDLDSLKPLYLAVADELERRIRAGEMPPRTRVPSARSLAVEAGVSTRTSEAAMRVLRERGLTVAVHGVGTFVAPEIPPAGPSAGGGE